MTNAYVTKSHTGAIYYTFPTMQNYGDVKRPVVPMSKEGGRDKQRTQDF